MKNSKLRRILPVLAVVLLAGLFAFEQLRNDNSVPTDQIAQILTGETSDEMLDETAPDAIDATESEDANPADITQFIVDRENSQVFRTGRKIIGDAHAGTLGIRDGFLARDSANERINGAQLTLAMDEITVTDLTGGAAESLADHLREAEFFNTAEFPTAEFVLDSISASGIVGDFTMLGTTNTISVPATVSTSEDRISIDANFFLDRTQRGLDSSAGIIDNFIEISIQTERIPKF